MATEKQLAHYERMRVARAAKQSTPNQEPNSSSFMTDDKVWFEGFLVALRNREVKSVADVLLSSPIADEILKVYRAKFK